MRECTVHPSQSHSGKPSGWLTGGIECWNFILIPSPQQHFPLWLRFILTHTAGEWLAHKRDIINFLFFFFFREWQPLDVWKAVQPEPPAECLSTPITSLSHHSSLLASSPPQKSHPQIIHLVLSRAERRECLKGCSSSIFIRRVANGNLCFQILCIIFFLFIITVSGAVEVLWHSL